MASFNNGVIMKNNKLKIQPIEEIGDYFINIKPSSHFVPEWYRESESVIDGYSTNLIPEAPKVTTSTYKKCTPLFDAMTTGYMAYLTADIEVMKRSDGMPFIAWRTQRNIVTEHNNNQWEGLPNPEGYHKFVYKWHNQHRLEVPPGYSLMFTSPINRFDLPFLNITGIVDADDYTDAIHFPFFISKSFTGIIKKDTPICQIIPIKRDSWSREITPYSHSETIKNSEYFYSTIKRSYKNNFWKKKEYK
jgi:hypothetical protein